jgi:hypothetical protein
LAKSIGSNCHHVRAEKREKEIRTSLFFLKYDVSSYPIISNRVKLMGGEFISGINGKDRYVFLQRKCKFE